MDLELLQRHNQGFPMTWTTSKFEVALATQFYNHFFGNSGQGLIINCTWLEFKLDKISETLQTCQIDHVLLHNFSDEWPPNTEQFIDTLLSQFGIQCQIVGNVQFEDNNRTYFPYWYVVTNKFFDTTNHTQLNNPCDIFNNVFLCYNRKPHHHRVETFKLFQSKNILHKGVFTLGKDFSGCHGAQIPNTISFPGNQPDSAQGAMSEADEEYGYGIIADAFSLGDLQTWRDSFLVVVNETSGSQSPHLPFITEKTFKPIIGKRPFIVLGPSNVNTVLQNMGFTTFEDLVTPETLADFISGTDAAQCAALYDQFRERIEHNHAHFYAYKHQLLAQYSFLDSLLVA